MCGGHYVRRGMKHGQWRRGREFLGRDVEKMSPGARISVRSRCLCRWGSPGYFWSLSRLLCGGSSRPTSGLLSLRSGCSRVGLRG